MRIAMFYHSLISDWNHGNAHFLRGIVSELLARGHKVAVYEPFDNWSLRNLVLDHGAGAISRFRAGYPKLESIRYKLDELDLEAELDDVDVVIVHEWNEHSLVQSVGLHRARNRNYLLFFHDTHHRSRTAPELMSNYDLTHYDGVLAFGESIREIYLREGWAARVWTWHEAADTRIFYPRPWPGRKADLVWVGNWGDDERSAELHEFLLDPVRDLQLRACVYGVRYPPEAQQVLASRDIEYGGWLPNYEVPAAFARHRLTVHVPRRPYVQALDGIPTIRPFEALACGIPLVSSPWPDTECLFTPGRDFLMARNGAEMRRCLTDLLHDEQMALELAEHGRHTILERHTCAHRVDELFRIVVECGGPKENEPNENFVLRF
jgi:spore maturation protein CgeB